MRTIFVNVNVNVHLYSAVWLYAGNNVLVTLGKGDGKRGGGGLCVEGDEKGFQTFFPLSKAP